MLHTMILPLSLPCGENGAGRRGATKGGTFGPFSQAQCGLGKLAVDFFTGLSGRQKAFAFRANIAILYRKAAAGRQGILPVFTEPFQARGIAGGERVSAFRFKTQR